MNINRIILGGNLTRKPELSTTKTKGTSVCKFSIAYNEFQGSEKSTYYFNVVVYGTTADNCGKYLDKGSCVLVEGKLTSRNYKAKDGTSKNITEIIAANVIFISKTKSQQNDSDSDY